MSVTPTSNWLIPNKILVGAYPDPLQNFPQKIVEAGIDTFVCLQTEEELKKFRPYRPLLPDHINLVSFHIPDRCIANDDDVTEFIHDLLLLLQDGKKLYIFCFGGHGRTGLISALLISHYLKISADDALKLTRDAHSLRPHNSHKKTPGNRSQVEQVKRLGFA